MTIPKTPVRAPRANAYASGSWAPVRRECLDRLVVLGRRHLEVILADYVKHYNGHRPHRSLDQQAPTALAAPPDTALDLDMARLRSHDVLGGIIHEYRLVA